MATRVWKTVAMKSRPNIVLTVTAVLVIALAVVAFALAGTKKAPSLGLTTPEGTVQAYLQAFADGDDARVVELLDPSLGCKVPLQESYVSRRISAALVGSTTSGDTATVTVEITSYTNGLMEGWSERQEFRLKGHGQGWLLTDSPWPYFSCE